MKTLFSKLLLGKIKTVRKLKASSTTDIGAEGTTVAEPLDTKEERLLGNPIDFPFSPLSLLECEKLFRRHPSFNRTIETNYKIIKTIEVPIHPTLLRI